MGQKLRKPWDIISQKHKNFGVKIYEDAKSLKEEGLDYKSIVAYLKRTKYAQIPSDFIKLYVERVFQNNE